jgi:RNA polymerase sigma-70 factor (ECF subfamily)
VIAGGILKDVGSEEDMEECVAGVYLALWKNPASFDPEKGSLKSYLALLTRSRALDRCRKLARFASEPLEDGLRAPGADLEDGLIERELFGALGGAVRALGEPDREIVIRRWFFGEKPATIAARCALPVREVNGRLYQSKLKLRRLLNKEELS